MTYAQLFARSMRLVRLFARRGLVRGDRVAVLLANNVAVLDSHFASAAAGTVVVVRPAQPRSL